MYLPDHFRVDDIAQMHALMRARPLAALVSAGAAGLYATHLPTVLKEEGPSGAIECHLSRANPHWKDLAAGGEALMIFQGPEAYVTPNWYPSKAEHGKTVPTWNYAAVHAYGRPAVMPDAVWLRRHVGELTDQQERSEAQPWAVSDAPERYVEVMLRGIVGFRRHCAARRQMEDGQNHEMKDRAGVVRGLGAPRARTQVAARWSRGTWCGVNRPHYCASGLALNEQRLRKQSRHLRRSDAVVRGCASPRPAGRIALCPVGIIGVSDRWATLRIAPGHPSRLARRMNLGLSEILAPANTGDYRDLQGSGFHFFAWRGRNRSARGSFGWRKVKRPGRCRRPGAACTRERGRASSQIRTRISAIADFGGAKASEKRLCYSC
jgi:transcriptional regulator